MRVRVVPVGHVRVRLPLRFVPVRVVPVVVAVRVRVLVKLPNPAPKRWDGRWRCSEVIGLSPINDT